MVSIIPLQPFRRYHVSNSDPPKIRRDYLRSARSPPDTALEAGSQHGDHRFTSRYHWRQGSRDLKELAARYSPLVSSSVSVSVSNCYDAMSAFGTSPRRLILRRPDPSFGRTIRHKSSAWVHQPIIPLPSGSGCWRLRAVRQKETQRRGAKTEMMNTTIKLRRTAIPRHRKILEDLDKTLSSWSCSHHWRAHLAPSAHCMMKWGECGSEFLIYMASKQVGKHQPVLRVTSHQKPLLLSSNSSGFGYSKPLVCWLSRDQGMSKRDEPLSIWSPYDFTRQRLLISMNHASWS